MRCVNLQGTYKPFTHTFYDKKPENALLYIKPEYPTKK